MGSGGKQTHTTYATEPTATAVLEPEEETTVQPGADTATTASQDHLAEVENALAELNGALGQGPDAYAMVDPADDELAHWYAQLYGTVAHARNHLAQALAAGTPMDIAEDYDAQIKKASAGALATLPTEELQQLAAVEGLEHPELIGLNHQEGKPHALAHWLDPAYPGAPSKEKIQAKASERYNALCAGETIAGLTLADVNGQTSTTGAAAWTASPAEVDDVFHVLTEQVQAYKQAGAAGEGETLKHLIDTENTLASAQCPEDPQKLSHLQGSSFHLVESTVEGLAPNSTVLDAALDQAQQQGLLSAEQRNVLTKSTALRLARHAVPEDARKQIAQVAENRQQTIADLQTAFAELKKYQPEEDGPLQLPNQPQSGLGSASAEQVVDFANAAQQYFAAESAVHAWAHDAPAGFEKATSTPLQPTTPAWLTKEFNAWVVGKDTGALKQVAAQLGLENGSAMTKADAKKWIAAQWDPDLDKDAIQKSVIEKAMKADHAGIWNKSTLDKLFADGAAAAGGKKPSDSAAQGAQSPKKAPQPAAEKTGFAGQHAKLVEALKHHGAAASEVPKRLDATIVAGHDFGSGTSAAGLGGMHTKSLHTGPDGQQWMFKPDHQGKGARAEAEAVASQIYEAAGVAAVPTYTAKVGGKPGVVQPLVKNASQLPDTPESWSQSDVDSLVRNHVASWVMGDHDTNPSNVLRTPSGGLVPVDAGQAFKHYGKDRLKLDYHPNAKFGATPPAHQLAYKAAMNGELAPGVKIKPSVAHPVIKKLESIPDAQWRAMLHTTAHQGAKNSDIAWVPTMRHRAAKKHGITEEKVSSSQIAEAFLDHACERKNSLRSAFSAFFTKDLKLDGSALKYGA